MSGTQQQHHTKQDAPVKKGDEPALKGTFVSVLLLGAFIAISWIGVFVLFIVRN
ncbi:cytochrome c oxidase subunit 2A [Paenibacillus kobensis]|uniref:cytochrome c oxidase subunit 2A n=1 Tax=Paenibacillus kobensis TaxID=59841 RepID=UPI000FD9D32A|nr:cytochrome c oxidase subunit 2A [Paenibacillus kobensis]